MRSPGPRITVAPRVEPTISVRRRWPAEAVEMIEKDEAEFTRAIGELERDALFVQLREGGHIRKVSLRGRVPPEKYEAYLDHEVATLIQEHGIADGPDWREDFDPHLRRPSLPALARKYGVTEAVARRIVRYLQHLSEETDDRQPTATAAPQQGSRLDGIASAREAPDEEAAATCAAFVEAHGLSREQFVRDFLAADEPDLEALARRYGAGRAEIRRVLEAVESARVYDLICDSPAPRGPSAPPPQPPPDETVACVERDPNIGIPRLTFLEGSEYAMMYELKPSAFGALGRLAETPGDAEQLLYRLRLVNQRKSLIYRMATTLFREQYDYFLTSDEARLRPLSQAELARRLEEDTSTISRIIRRKRLAFGQRAVPLQYLCQRTRDVVGRLAERFPELSDRQLQEKLERGYGCSVSRRTVNYHRRGLQRRLQRQGQARGSDAG